MNFILTKKDAVFQEKSYGESIDYGFWLLLKKEKLDKSGQKYAVIIVVWWFKWSQVLRQE